MATKETNVGISGDNTVIGPSILINGKLSGDEDLTVRGRVEGEIHLSHTLIIETSGVVKANVSVKNAVVSGVVVGNINATESVELTKEGRMVGDITSPRVILVDGASFKGRVDMGEVQTGLASDEQRSNRAGPASREMARSAVRPSAPMSRPTPPPPPTRSESKVQMPVAFVGSAKRKVMVKKRSR